MNPVKFSDHQLRAYLDESLPAGTMGEVEQSLREDESLRKRLVELAGMREAGVHALGEIWRRGRLSCPNRQQLGSFLLGAISEEEKEYIQFHLEQIGCRLCQANVDDLRAQQEGVSDATQSRRRRYFQTSAGYLRKES
ncbi:MAG: hypothetical protein Aurels2KO_09840 [Aureliella sp.]